MQKQERLPGHSQSPSLSSMQRLAMPSSINNDTEEAYNNQHIPSSPRSRGSVHIASPYASASASSLNKYVRGRHDKPDKPGLLQRIGLRSRARASSNTGSDDAYHEHATRLMDRGAPFAQSKGRFNIKHKNVRQSLKARDMFHSLLYMSSWKTIIAWVGLLVAAYIAWAFFFWALPDDRCGLDPSERAFMDNVMLSIITISTIGYGVDGDDLFLGCPEGIFVVGTASIVGIMFDALAIGIIFMRLSRAQKRAYTMLFSDQAILNLDEGNKLSLQFRVAEMRRHQLIESHVRLYYVWRAELNAPQRINRSNSRKARKKQRGKNKQRKYYVIRSQPLRTQHPDDETGGMLFLAIPQTVVHRVDDWSALHPTSSIYDDLRINHQAKHNNNESKSGDNDRQQRDPSTSYKFGDVLQRENDFETGNREHRTNRKRPSPTPLEVLQHMREVNGEIIAVLEGIDMATSSTLQSRHSYTADDIVLNGDFEDSVLYDTEEECGVLDFDSFHTIRPREVDEHDAHQALASSDEEDDDHDRPLLN